MKVSVSLPDEDVQFLDEYARRNARSRSAAVHEAVVTLRNGTLADAYEQAWSQWDVDSEPELWDRVTADGL
jgi:Arc/MetJ-type ribon-helix-helix transcriptional regulator